MGEDFQWRAEWFCASLHFLFDAYLAQKKDESYCRLRVANQRGGRDRSAGQYDSTTMTFLESVYSSVASASAVVQGGSGTNSGRPSKVKE